MRVVWRKISVTPTPGLWVKSAGYSGYDSRMGDKPLFPVYVCLDDGTVMQIENENRILYHLEAIDIENDEYMFWDTTGHAFRVLIKKGRLGGFEKINMNKLTLQQAFEQYAQQLRECGAAVDTMTGTPEELWAKIERAKKALPRPRGFFSRIFGRKQDQ